jgi:hypothetical protein
MISLAESASLPARRDIRFVLLTILVFAVVLNFAITIYKLWDALLASRYAPTPTVILIAVGIGLPYFWTKTAAERAVLQRRVESQEIDHAAAEIALRALYRGLFMTAMVALLLLTALRGLA